MKGILNERFALIGLTDQEIEAGEIEIDADDVFVLEKGDNVEVLKIIKTDEFIGGIGYVVFNPETFESRTVSSIFVDLIEE